MHHDIARTRTTDITLVPTPIPKDQILAGRPAAAGSVLFESRDGKVTIGIWTCSPGSFSWTCDADETCYILEGRATIDRDGRPPVTIGRGEVVRFPKGLPTRWTVIEPIRKLYVNDAHL